VDHKGVDRTATRRRGGCTIGRGDMNDSGLNFGLTEAQREFQSSLRKFVSKELPKPVCREMEARSEFPHDLWELIVAHGLHGVGALRALRSVDTCWLVAKL